MGVLLSLLLSSYWGPRGGTIYWSFDHNIRKQTSTYLLIYQLVTLMNTGIQTFKLSTPCCEPLVNYDALMCLPGAIIGTYYCGLAGCFYGAVKSIYAESAFAAGKVLMADNTQVIAERIITPACASNMINKGIECGANGFNKIKN